MQSNYRPDHRRVGSAAVSDTSVVVAAKDFGHTIEDAITRWLKLGIHELVVVDGLSSDNSRQIYARLVDRFGCRLKVIYQAPVGLAAARLRGIQSSKGSYILHAGPDNVMPADTLEQMVYELQNASLVSCTTELMENSSYFNKCHALSKRRFLPGSNLPVVGTPYVARRELFEQYPFNTLMRNSDDTEFCDRILRDGHIITRIESPCFEQGFTSLENMRERWRRWGRGDSLYYRLNYREWTRKRRFRSLLHPLTAEVIEPFRALSLGNFIYAFPFLALACFFRYTGWIRHVWNVRKASTSSS